jgi:O-antigen/teichoic acid export membrane protein
MLLALNLALVIKGLSKKENRSFKILSTVTKLINTAPKDSVATTVYLGAGVVANFLNYAYNAYLTRQLAIEDFGIISLAGSFIFISSIPLSALSGAIVKKVAFHLGKEKLALAGFWLHVRKKTFNISFAFTIIWLIATPLSMKFFNVETPLPFLLIAPIFVLNALTAVDIGYISGLLKFYILSLMLIAEAVSKIVLTWVILKLGLVDYIYLAIPGALFASFIVGYYFALKYASAKHHSVSQDKIEFPTKSFVSFIISLLSTLRYIFPCVLSYMSTYLFKSIYI